MKPLVSIIMPAYNAARYIKETIESVLTQSYSNWEMIIVDDGSTDNIAEIIKEYSEKDARIQYIYQTNKGQSSARNRGIKEAQGKYIAFLDADDLFLPAKLEEQVKFLENNSECGVSYCKIYHFLNDNKQQLFYNPQPNYSGDIFERVLTQNFINPLAVVLRKEVLDKYGAFKEDWRRVDEQYLWVKLSFNKVKFYYLDKVLAYYRVHRQSLSNQAQYLVETSEKYLELIDLVEKWKNDDNFTQKALLPLRKKIKKNLYWGKLMVGGGLVSKILLVLYNLRMRLKVKKISNF